MHINIDTRIQNKLGLCVQQDHFIDIQNNDGDVTFQPSRQPFLYNL